MNKLSKGFTLIELLIVIAVLGILAVAVLSAINPIEQINRSRDTGSRSDSEQLIGAIDRYYATNGYYPWVTSSDPSLDTSIAWVAGNVNLDDWFDDEGTVLVLDKLAAAGTGELKESFINRIVGSSYNPLTAYNTGLSGDSTYICFLPKSSAFKAEAYNRCNATEGVPSDYPAEACATDCAAGVNTGCYSCLP